MRIRMTIRAKISVLCVFVIAIFLATNIVIVRPTVSRAITNNTNRYMQDMAKAYYTIITTYKEQDISDNSLLLKIAETLQGVQVNNLETSEFIIADLSGNIIYDSDQEKTEKTISNETLNEKIAEVSKNNQTEEGLLEYDDNGARQGAYYFEQGQDMIMITSATESEVLQPVTTIVSVLMVTAGIVMVIIGIVSALISRSITAPLKSMTNVIKEVSELHMEKNQTIEKLAKRTDEIGTISSAIAGMMDKLHTIVENISNSSERINQKANDVSEVTEQIHSFSEDNSATTEELAASMEETSASSQSIGSKVGYIDGEVTEIVSQAEKGKTLAGDIMVRATSLEQETETAKQQVEDLYGEVKQNSATAMEQANAVEKIVVMASTIKEIAEQTSLLALNASIEAARAGENGKGFAVVAEEIGHLAVQSSNTVEGIASIVREIEEAVQNMSSCLNNTGKLIEEQVLIDYKKFVQAGMNYNQDAKELDRYMGEIYDSVEELKKVTEEINTAIDGINGTIEESASGVTDIAEKTATIAELTMQANETVQENKEVAKELEQIVEVFTL